MSGPEEAVLRLEDVGVRRHTADRLVLDGVDRTAGRAGTGPCSRPTAPARPPLLRLLGALTHPTTGGVEVLGSRLGRVGVREPRARIGHVTSAQRVPRDLSAHAVVLTGPSGTVQPL